MKQLAATITAVFFSLVLVSSSLAGDAIAPETQAKLDAKAKSLQPLGADPKVVAAVKEYNATPSAEAKAMTNDKWKEATIMDPFVRSLSKNPLADYLNSKKDDSVTEMFISGADGGKVAFLAKTTSWNHKGKEKHDVPMTGKNWQGPLEVDASTGKQQVQISFPVLDGATPIGSVVVGLSLSKL